MGCVYHQTLVIFQQLAETSALQRSRHPLHRAPPLACDLGRVPDRLASLQRIHNVLVLRQECGPIQARAFSTSKE
jgi:hypothetical protein